MSHGPPRMIGKYRIDTTLGRGATSIVYKASDQVTGAPVAVKLLRAELLADGQRGAALERFHREAEIGKRLTHPNIVKVLDDGWVGGVPYLVMELVQGQDLSGFLDAVPLLPVDTVLRIALPVLAALGYAHDHGVIHRDVKPGNILLGGNGLLKLADFGIAHTRSSELTQFGDLVGTPNYMAPEQLRGERLDSRADLFSVGVILYILLTGVRPFHGSVAALMHQILTLEPPLPSETNDRVPADLDPIVMLALAKDRRERFASARDFANALFRTAQRAPKTDRAQWPVALSADQVTRVGTTVKRSGLNSVAVATAQQKIQDQLKALLGRATTAPLSDGVLAEVDGLFGRWFELEHGLADGPSAGTGAARSRAVHSLIELCLQTGLNPLAALILSSAPMPDRPVAAMRRDWIQLVRLFIHLRAALARLGEHSRADALSARLAADLGACASPFAGRLGRLAVTNDNPDLGRITTDFLRLDALQMALDELGFPDESRSLKRTVQVLSSLVLGKVAATMRGFVAAGDQVERFAVGAILSDAESLIALAARLLDERGISSAELEPTDQLAPDALADFAEAATTLARHTISELRGAALAGETGDSSFVPRLRQLSTLYQLAAEVPGAAEQPVLKTLTAEIQNLIESLVEALLTPAAATGDPEIALGAVFEMAKRFGWTRISARTFFGLRRGVVSGAF